MAEQDDLMEALARRIGESSRRAGDELAKLDAEMIRLMGEQPFERVVNELAAHPELESEVLAFIRSRIPSDPTSPEKKTEPTP